LKTFVSDMVLLGWRHFARVLVVMCIDITKQRWKRRTEFKAKATAMTQVVNSGHLLSGVGLI
jgi:hypothetical protein